MKATDAVVLDRLLERHPDLTTTDHRGVLVRAALMENA